MPSSPAHSHDDQPVVQDPRILHIAQVNVAPYTNTQLGDVINIGTHYHVPHTCDADRNPQFRNESSFDQSWFRTFSGAFWGVVAGSCVGDVIKARFAAAFDYAQDYTSCTYQASLQLVHQMNAQNGCTGSVCLAAFLVNLYVFGGEATAQIFSGTVSSLLFQTMIAKQLFWAHPTFNRFARYRPKTSLDLQAITYMHWTIRLRELDHIVMRIVGQDIIEKYCRWHLAYWAVLRCIAVSEIVLWPCGILSFDWTQAIDEIFCRYTCPGTMEILEVTTILVSKVHYPLVRQAAYQLAGRIAFSVFTPWAGTSQAGLPAYLQILHGADAMYTSLFLMLCLQLTVASAQLCGVWLATGECRISKIPHIGVDD